MKNRSGHARTATDVPLWKRSGTERYNFPQRRPAMTLPKLCVFARANALRGCSSAAGRCDTYPLRLAAK